jgi:muramoyltetrapeptide carboxypeptidase
MPHRSIRIVKPPRLNPGDLIGIAAPSGPVLSHQKLNKGIRYLETLGYMVVLAPHAVEQRGYLAGFDKDRAQDLNDLFGNPHVRAIFVARGGYGMPRILPLLDYQLIRRNPKILVGYSDVTALQLGLLAKTGLVTFAGPMVATDIFRLQGLAEETFWRCLTSTKPLGRLGNPTGRKLSTINKGIGHGRLVGGNLSVLSALAGTEYLPDLRGAVLLLEEIDEQPYRIDRMLHQLKLAKLLDRLAGVVLGGFTNCVPSDKRKPSLSLGEIFRDTFASVRAPVLVNLHHGHVADSLTLPLGVSARVDGGRKTVEIVEGAVR